MKILIATITTLIFTSCNFDNKGGLEEETKTLELTYVAWACDCANWVTEEDLEKHSENINDTLAKQSIFIEPANQSVELPDTLGYSNDIIKFTGQFYKEKRFPKGYQSIQDTEKSRVFRYNEYEVVKSNYREYQNLKSKNE